MSCHTLDIPIRSPASFDLRSKHHQFDAFVRFVLPFLSHVGIRLFFGFGATAFLVHILLKHCTKHSQRKETILAALGASGKKAWNPDAAHKSTRFGRLGQWPVRIGMDLPCPKWRKTQGFQHGDCLDDGRQLRTHGILAGRIVAGFAAWWHIGGTLVARWWAFDALLMRF